MDNLKKIQYLKRVEAIHNINLELKEEIKSMKSMIDLHQKQKNYSDLISAIIKNEQLRKELDFLKLLSQELFIRKDNQND